MPKLILPARCTGVLPLNIEKPYLVAERKLDGSRYVLYVGQNVDPYQRQAGNTLLSRHVSKDLKHKDRTENIPHVTQVKYSGLEGTIIDGEIMANDFLGTNSVMNSSPRLAVQKQDEKGYLNFHVFDVMVFRGTDIRGLPLSKRRRVLEEVCKRMNNEHVKVIPQFKKDFEKEFLKEVESGGEGLVVKDIRCGYGINWYKLKKSYEVSCIISGFKPGNGKYKDKVGAIALSVYHRGKLVEVGFASGFDDSLRKKMTDNFKKYEGKVVDIFVQEIQKKDKNGIGRLRHPTFYRLKECANAKEITSEKLLRDIQEKVRSDRMKWRRK